MMFGKVFLIGLLAYAHAQTYNTFNSGGCTNNDCCSGLTCACNETRIIELISNFSKPADPVLDDADGSISGITTESVIGWMANHSVSTADKCDHYKYVTVIQDEPFLYDGQLKYIEWYVGPDCRDQEEYRNLEVLNTNCKFGIFEKTGTCSFKLRGYIQVDRRYYETEIAESTDTTPTQPIRYDFTQADLVTLGINDYRTKGLYVGHQCGVGGGIAYQSWQASFENSDNPVCIFDNAQESFEMEDWSTYDFVAKPSRSVIEVKTRQYWRRYSLGYFYQSL